MKGLHWTTVVLGICVVSISSLVLRVDDPLTAYDESATPVYLAASVSIHFGLTPNRIASRSVTIGRGWRDLSAMSYATSAGHRTRASHPKVKVLCPLLC
ncbi:MAG TPA: hypothetical protein VNS62_10455 [Candidatus Udaeobacter sp.]|nr:hypothetical protein [Candidatus Udaeobacter sp.]